MKWTVGRVVLYPGFVALLSASAYFGSLRLLAALLTAAAAHELGHVAAVWCTGRKLNRLTLTALGAELTLEGGELIQRESGTEVLVYEKK